MKKLSLFSSLLCSALVFGCSDDKGPGGNSNTNQTNPTNPSGDDAGQSQTSDPDSTGPVNPTEDATGPVVGTSTGDSGDGTAAGTSTTGFITPPDGMEGMKECDQWTQDCKEGEKCMPYSGDGDNSWESLKCVPIDPNPSAPGSPCSVEGNGVSGLDNCEEGAMCWNVDPETNEGVCVSMCVGSPEAPDCVDPTTACSITNDGVLTLCLPSCDPLIQNCPGDDLCVYNPADGGNTFICTLNAAGETGLVFEPCEYINACQKGLNCFNPALAMECDPQAGGCCLPFCELETNAECPGVGQECIPYYEEGSAPPGLEKVGVCGLPS